MTALEYRGTNSHKSVQKTRVNNFRSRNNKSSEYNQFLVLTVVVLILIPVFLFCAVLVMVIFCSYKFWKLFVSAPNLCVQKDSVTTLKLFK